MAVLQWDTVGDRRFETGVDRGVLYPIGGPAVPWNGLSSVTEERTREVKSYYIDGVKYLDHHVPGSYSGKLQAFTYPNELEPLLGTMEFAPGVHVHDQSATPFHLCYRTRLGNDLEGVEYGYKIHLLYNILATSDDVTFNATGASIDPGVFAWKLSGTPSSMFGIRPTSHLSFDSTLMSDEVMAAVEATLYGDETTDPVLPDLVTLLGLVESLS